MRHLLLNIDAGEDPREPDELYRLAEVVSIACGGHAGDDETMLHALGAAKAGGAAAGAHPSYADRAGFGRVALAIPVRDVEESVRAQCARLATHAKALDVPLAYLKPHGALYHAANRDPGFATALVHAAADAFGDVLGARDFTLIAPPHGALGDAARAAGINFLREGFADRGTRPDGSLVPRGEPGALIADPHEAARRARELARSGEVDTICVHGDTPGTTEIARAVRAALTNEDAIA